MISNHPYSRYALALIMQEGGISSVEEVSHKLLIRFIKDGLNHFRVRPGEPNADEIRFDYVPESYLHTHKKYIGSHCNEGFFLTPNIISLDKAAKNAWNGLVKLKAALEKKGKFEQTESATMSVMPMAAKFNNGKLSQSPPKVSLLEASLCAITTSTPDKPALHSREGKANRKNYIPTAIIPDLPLDDLRKFISVFREMQRTQTTDLMVGKYQETDKDGKKRQNPFFRPKLSNGNFPHAPRRPELASAALLGAIGSFAREAGYPHSNVEEVLEKLKGAPMYIISYGKAQVVSYTHYVVDLAKNNRLNTIIDSLHRVWGMLYVSGNSPTLRNQKFDGFVLFASRFLQLYDHHTFKDFLSVRGEYPKELTILFTTFYRRVMKIDDALVKSATSLGRWLNRVAFFAACAELDVDYKNTEVMRAKGSDVSKLKAKTLVELESAAFSAKSATALVSQVITRAGRISGQDAPPEALPFIEAVTSGALGETEKESLENAKNMIVVFSRIRGAAQPAPLAEVVEGEAEEGTEYGDSNLSEDETE